MTAPSSVKKAVLAIGFLSFFFFIARSNAQTAGPQFMMTWQANQSYVPSPYAGKALPTLASSITASVELVSGGNILNLKSQTIYWYLDGNLIGGGVGAQHITFSPFANSGATTELKAELPNYNGAFLVHAINIPIVRPSVVAEAPYPGGQFSGNSITIKALPYFFNVPLSDLTYDWSVNGTPALSSENPDTAQINIPSGTAPGTPITVSLTAGDPTGFFVAQSTAQLTLTNAL